MQILRNSVTKNSASKYLHCDKMVCLTPDGELREKIGLDEPDMVKWVETGCMVDDCLKLWDAIPSIPDLQCSWQVLLQCAGPRCHHLLRTVPPRQCAGYAHGHDSGMQRTMEALLGRIPGSLMQVEAARLVPP